MKSAPLPYLYALSFLCLLIATTSQAQTNCVVLEANQFQAKSSGTCGYYTDCYGDQADCRDCNINSSACGMIRVPVQFTIIRDGNGNGDIPNQVIEDNLTFLQTAFQEAQMEFVQLAAPRKINNVALFHFNDDTSCGGDNDTDLVTALAIKDVINIFLIESFSRCGNYYSGGAYMPGGPQWMVLVKEDVSNYPAVLAHEMGHVFGLFHTHHNYFNAQAELPDGSNCHEGGDRICDTPADPRLNLDSDGSVCKLFDPDCDCYTVDPYNPVQCVGKEPCTYNGPAGYDPDMGNLMSYSPWGDCPRTHFTPCQSKKMRDVLAECQSNLCAPPPPPTVFDPEPITFGEPIPPIIAIDSYPDTHTGTCFNWYDAPTGGNLLATKSAVLRPIYGSGIGKIDAPGTYEYWVEMSTPYNADCRSVRSKITITINTNQTATTNFRLKATILLQGPYDASSNTMRNSLRTAELLPLKQPFDQAPFNYEGTEQVSNYNLIPNNVVDWVLIELRSTPAAANIIERKAAWVTSDGTLIDLTGNAGLSFEFPTANQTYYIVVRSRNHLPIMSQQAITLPNTTPYDFSDINLVKGGTLTPVGNNKYGMYAGDMDGNGTITVTDFNHYLQHTSIINTYLNSDCNFDKSTTVKDFNLLTPNTSIFSISDVRY